MFSTVSRAGASTKTVRITPAKVIFLCVLVRVAAVSKFCQSCEDMRMYYQDVNCYRNKYLLTVNSNKI